MSNYVVRPVLRRDFNEPPYADGRYRVVVPSFLQLKVGDPVCLTDDDPEWDKAQDINGTIVAFIAVVEPEARP